MCHSATVGGTVRGNTVQIVSTLPRLSGGSASQFFWGSQPCVPAAWLAERLLLAGDIESNPGPRPTLKTPYTHTHHQPPTLTKFTDSLISPPRPCPPPTLHSPTHHPKTPTHTSSPPAPTLTPYTLDQIQPVRPYSPLISPPHNPPHVPTPCTLPTHT